MPSVEDPQKKRAISALSMAHKEKNESMDSIYAGGFPTEYT